MSCPVCHRPADEATVCPTCHVAMVPSPYAAPSPFAPPGAPNAPSPVAPPQFAGAYSSPFDSPDAYPTAAYPPPTGVPIHLDAPPASPPVRPVMPAVTISAPTFPVAPPVTQVATPMQPAVPTWDRAGTKRPVEEPTSPVVTISAIVVGLLIVAVVGWLTLGGGDASDAPVASAGTQLTPTVPHSGPAAGQTAPLPDGWVTYRVPDGAWMFDVPAVPTVPNALPSSPTVQVVYAKADGNRYGFGWSQGQLAAGTDEGATLVEIMNGIAASRGAGNVTPTVLKSDRGPVVTATLDLTGGKALFVLRSIDRRPVFAMVVAGLGDPDPAIANRILDSFRPGG